MKIQNNKTKTSTTIITTLIIGLALLSPMTVLPNINAQIQSAQINSAQIQPTQYPDMPKYIPASIAPRLEQTTHYIEEKIKGHPGWIGLTRSTKDNVTILYIGPASKSPYSAPKLNGMQKTSGTTASPLSATYTIQQAVSPVSYESGKTSAYHIFMDLAAENPGSSLVDYLVNLNAWNGDKSEWMQNGFMYDGVGLTSYPNQWVANFDVHCAGCILSARGFPQALKMTTPQASDTIAEDTYAIGSGEYQMFVTDSRSNESVNQIYSAGDSVNALNLYKYSSGNYYQDSGTLAEDITNGGSNTYHWGNQYFVFDFWSSTSDSGTGACDSFDSPYPPNGGTNPVTTNTFPNPNCYDEMNYP
ncbi:MAG: hypothetical protein KGI02_08715 [Thaumarchaeota archaeon]|nr:hypothetical protein [Nitrososphaerota archaeon]